MRVAVRLCSLQGARNGQALPHPFFMFATPGAPIWTAPPTLERLMRGIRALGVVMDISPDPLPAPGPWCWAMPLWCNPLITAARGAGGPLEPYLLSVRPNMLDILVHQCQLTTLGEALAFAASLYGRRDVPPWRHALEVLITAIPPGYANAAREAARHLYPLPSFEDALAVILPRLGWRPPAHSALAAAAPLPSLSVKAATYLQSGPVDGLRMERFAAFATAALGAPATDAEVDGLCKLLPALWRLRWESANKEVYWRLLTDSMPKFGGHAAAGEARDWDFWASPVALAVRATLAQQLGFQPAKASVWLMLPPNGIISRVWHVVCLAAVAAMDHGARQHARLLSAQKQQQSQPAQPHSQTTRTGRNRQQTASQPLPAGRIPVFAARDAAVATFWGRLADFASLHHRGWRGLDGQLPEGSPFFTCIGGRLRVHRHAPAA